MSKHYALVKLEPNGNIIFCDWYASEKDAANDCATGNGLPTEKDSVYVVDVFDNKPDVKAGTVIGKWSRKPTQYSRQIQHNLID